MMLDIEKYRFSIKKTMPKMAFSYQFPEPK